jgi:hypothetical protein
LKVAESPNGGVYPVGSVIQLVPTEVMVKQPKGFNNITHDWEFFELNVSKDGTTINKRGFAEVVNRFVRETRTDRALFSHLRSIQGRICELQ